MNANEVIASLVKLQSNGDILVHPNDEVNLGQSSNDIIPSCIHLSAAMLIDKELLPALKHLSMTMEEISQQHHASIKTGRTHLMDAMPLSFAQEIGAWRAQINFAYSELHNQLPNLCKLAIGGTAVGTGVNTHPNFGIHVCKALSKDTGLNFTPASNLFRAISSQDTAVSLSGTLKTTAVSLTKITNVVVQ